MHKKHILTVVWEKYRERKNVGNDGFTLVEMIVTLVVLGIICSIGVMSLIGWYNYAEFKKNNEFARSIFSAAQIQLTQYAERGQLSQLTDAVTLNANSISEYSLNGLLTNEKLTLYDGDGNAVDLKKDVWEANKKSEKLNSDIYYLKADRGDYETYYIGKGLGAKTYTQIKSEYSDTEKESVYSGKPLKFYWRIKTLFDMIDPYISDKDMLNAAICIEFDPNPKVAQVYSVFYDNKVETFTYKEEKKEDSNSASLLKRAVSERKDKLVGYYGAEVLSKGTNPNIIRPIISNLTLYNEDTLNLYWTINESDALLKLAYTLNVYAAPDSGNGEGTLVGTIALGKTDKGLVISESTGSSSGIQYIAASFSYPVVTYDEENKPVTEWTKQDLTFPIEVSEDGKNSVRLYLDTLDLSVDECNSKSSEAMQQSSSIYRMMNLENADNLYITVRGARDGVYKQTVERKSNTENQFFGKLTPDGSKRTYTIENARHLNNIRYYEAYHSNDTTEIVYRLTTDINWEKIVNSGKTFKNMLPVYPNSTDEIASEYKFHPIIALSYKSSFMTSDSEPHILDRFTLDAADMPNVEEYIEAYNSIEEHREKLPLYTTGLIIQNYGTISNITLSNVSVTGSMEDKEKVGSTGAFCGKNQGNLNNLTVQSGTVTGVSNVGGITGAVYGAGYYEKLINRAEVSGQLYVGGITGKLEITSGELLVKGCKNYGKVYGIESDTSEAYFIGGIVGYSNRIGDKKTASVRIEDCSSSPAYEKQEIDNLIASVKGKINPKPDDEEGTEKDSLLSILAGKLRSLFTQKNTEENHNIELTGNFVGGIVGFNKDADIIKCNTLREKSSIQGYVIGKNYVGGIVGLNSGNAGSTLSGGTKNNRNQANVIGNSYIGGISGCNVAVKLTNPEKLNDQDDPDFKENLEKTHNIIFINTEIVIAVSKTYDSSIKISNWINEGVILAISEYAGGIAGANYGNIQECNSNVDYSSDIQNMIEVATNSQYAGGIVGYNIGEIGTENTQLLSAYCVISGRNYVGGLAGYNDLGGKINNYELSGGYISGNHFVGGFIGLNADASIFETNIVSNVNSVTGDYFVGGIIGGNLLPVPKDSEGKEVTKIPASFKTDNFLGHLYAYEGAFAGGFIGFNDLLSSDVSKEDIQSAADALCSTDKLTEITSTDKTEIAGMLETIEEPLEALFSEKQNVTCSMVIEGSGSDTPKTDLGEIVALVYVGGVIGYNQDTTKLTIQNVENITPIRATAYIQRKEDGVNNFEDGTQKKYSYAGGIIGKVAENVTLINCSNKGSGSVSSQGTYKGGLAEINYGLIQNCMAGTLGEGGDTENTDYIGGLVGANVGKTVTSGETIIKRGLDNCSVNGTIMGKNYIGGLAAENYGDIVNPKLDCAVVSSGKNVGGAVGYGYKGSSISFSESKQSTDSDMPATLPELKVRISGSAYYVGGLVGTNNGDITVPSSSDLFVNMNGSIEGAYHVGGFVGRQMGKATIVGLKNLATVRAEEGYAGGIVAAMWKLGDADLNNDLILQSEGISESGNDIDSSVIERCQNKGTVTSESEIKNADNAVSSAAGGITAVNYGTIRQCVDYGGVKAGSGYSGGITAINYNKIENSRVNDEQKLLTLEGDQYVGGIAAINEEKAYILNSSVQNVQLNNQTSTTTGYMGGVAGYNYGNITNTVVGVAWGSNSVPETGKYVYADASREAGDYVSEAVTNAKNSSSDDQYTFADLTAGNTVRIISYALGISAGGITGYNEGSIEGKSSTEYSVVAAELGFTENSMSYYGYMGGIAGVNEGSIQNYEFNGLIHGTANNPAATPEFNPNYDYEQSKNRIYGYGGIAGLNGSDLHAMNAEIKDCSIGTARIHGIGDSNNRVNLGGVAGVNGENSKILRIRFGTRTEITKLFTEKKNSQTKQGSIWIGTDAYGHIGGVVGYNLGEITDIGNWNDYKSARESYFDGSILSPDTEIEKTGVLVINDSGHTGGIIGFNRRTGRISNALTGVSWMVYSRIQGQDNGTGGIIGYNISEQDLTSCDNHATVIKMVGNSVGGMIGRNENATTSSWRLYDCRNYGEIYATARAGGMIGHWKYKGGTLEDCVNYGHVEADLEGVGGMVGMMYTLDVGESLNMVGCKNHGTVGKKNRIQTGGMLGTVSNTESSGRYIKLYNCVNTALIGGTDKSAGMVADAAQATVTLTACRNYGYSLDGCNSDFNGLYASSVTNMVDCIAVTDQAIAYPISSQVGKTTTGGYYFVPKTEEEEDIQSFFYVSTIEASYAKMNANSYKYLHALTNSKNIESNTPYWEKIKVEDEGYIDFIFNEPVYLDKDEALTLFWNRDVASTSNNFRYYLYDLEFYKETDDSEPVYSTEGSESVNEKDDERDRWENGHVHSCPDELDGISISRIRVCNFEARLWGSGQTTNAALREFTVKGVNESLYEKALPNINKKTNGSDSKTAISADKKYVSYVWDLLDEGSVSEPGKGIALSVSDTDNKASNLSGKTISNLNGQSINDIYRTDEKGTRFTNSLGAYSLYETLDTYLFFEPKKIIGPLTTPTIINAEAQGGYYQVNWGAISYATYYDVEYTYYKLDANGRLTDGLGSDSQKNATAYIPQIQIPSNYTENGVSADGVIIRVKAKCPIIDEGKPVIVESEWSDPEKDKGTIYFGVSLPMPQVHYELVEINASNCYRIVLDNRNEYETFVKQNFKEGEEDNITLANIDIVTKLKSDKEIIFSAEDGAYLNVAKTDYMLVSGKASDASNILLTCYASSNTVSGYDPSTKVIREAALPTNSAYSGSRMGQVVMARNDSTEVGFFGTTIDNLSYRTTLSQNAKWVLNYRTEMVAVDPILNVEVAVAVSPQTRTTTSSITKAVITLNGFPTDFLNKQSGKYIYQNLMVRMYPTKMSNDVFYQGWQVKLLDTDSSDTDSVESSNSKVTYERLQGLYVDDYGKKIRDNDKENQKKENQLILNGTVKNGYVIEAQGDGLYTLYYNTLLRSIQEKDFPATEDYLYSGVSTYCLYQVVHHKIDLATELNQPQPTPVLYINPEKDENGWKTGDYESQKAGNEFDIVWDQKAYSYVEEYDGVSKSIYPYDGKAEYQITVTATLPDNKGTTVLVNKKNINTDNNEANNHLLLNSSNWSYTNIHVTLTRLGKINGGRLDAFPSTNDNENFPLRLRLSQIGKPNITLQRDGDDIVMKDGLDYVISWNGIASSSDASVATSSEITNPEKEALAYYEIVIKGMSSKVTKTYTTNPDGDDPDGKKNCDVDVEDSHQTTKKVILKEFQRGETIQVIIQAIAKENQDIYRDSITGAAGELILPSRLFAPDMGREEDEHQNLTAVSQSVLSVDDFQAGCLELHMQPENYTAGVQFQIAMELYKSRSDAESRTNRITTITTLPEKSDTDRTNMTKELSYYSYILKDIPSEYAGTCVRVILRAVSASNISSVWTEEDVSEGEHNAVAPYRIFQLPQVKIDPVDFDELTGSEKFEYNILKPQEEPSTLPPATMIQQTVTYTESDQAEEYKLYLIELPQNAERMATSSNAVASASDAMVVSDVSEIIVKRDKDTDTNEYKNSFTVYYQSTNRTYANKGMESVTLLIDNPDKDLKGYTKLPWIKPFQLLTSNYHINIAAYMKAESVTDETNRKQIKFTIALPDFASMEGENGIEPVNYTEQILVQAIPDKDKPQFTSSNWAYMARTSANAEFEKKEPIGMEQNAVDPKIINDTADASAKSGVSYEISGEDLDSDTRYLVSVSIGEEELGYFAVPRNGDVGVVVNYASVVWLPEWMAKYEKKSIELTFCNIFDVGSGYGGGISKWADSSHSVTLPQLTASREIELIQSLSDSTEYTIKNTSVTRSRSSIQTLGVRQTSVEWIYRMEEDSKITGYDIDIEGIYGKRDYHMKLDLSRNVLGQYVGLDDYLEPEGKDLYSVVYNLEGDSVINFDGMTASGSDAILATMADAALATASNSSATMVQNNSIALKAYLKAEFISMDDDTEGIRFTLVLPDAPPEQWEGSAYEAFMTAFEGDGLYHTKCVKIEPVMVNRYYEMPETGWFYLEKTMMEIVEESMAPKQDTVDGYLLNDLN